jgi:hypothetical protein
LTGIHIGLVPKLLLYEKKNIVTEHILKGKRNAYFSFRTVFTRNEDESYISFLIVLLNTWMENHSTMKMKYLSKA